MNFSVVLGKIHGFFKMCEFPFSVFSNPYSVYTLPYPLYSLKFRLCLNLIYNFTFFTQTHFVRFGIF